VEVENKKKKKKKKPHFHAFLCVPDIDDMTGLRNLMATFPFLIAINWL
jgi:hypothetical protein